MIELHGKEVKFETFPNGETRLNTDGLPEPNMHIRRLIFKYENDGDLIRLMMLKNYFDLNRIIPNNLVISYMPYSRMDRSENGSPFTLKYITNFINSLNFEKITVIEPHSDVTCALLDRAEAKYVNFDLVEHVKKEVGFDEVKDFLVFPDAGAQKRYSKMKANNVLVGNKVRTFGNGVIESLELIGKMNAIGAKAIIVDDLSSFGGTFIQTADHLKTRGFDEVYLLVAHAENNVFKRNERTGKLLFEHIDKLFTTDSLLSEQNNWENQRFKKQLKVYPIVDVLSGEIKEVVEEKSPLRYEIGNKVKVKLNKSGHRFAIGEEIEILAEYPTSNSPHYKAEGKHGYWYIGDGELE